MTRGGWKSRARALLMYGVHRISEPASGSMSLLVLEEQRVLDHGMNSLVDDMPIRGRASVDLMSLDSIVLNADGGACRDGRRASPGSPRPGCAPGPRDAGHDLEGQ